VRRALRWLGLLLIVAGLGMVAWAVTVWQWQDPFTAIYTKYQQDNLADELEEREETFVPAPAPAPPAQRRRPPATPRVSAQDRVAADAARYRRSVGRGAALGRLDVPRLDLDAVVVNGTDHDSLTRGPGHYIASALPGQGELVYVAGHRTTYGAPFAHIDALKAGDPVTMRLPYGTFHYVVTGHRIVDDNDVSVLRSRGRDELILQACHPRFFASQRWLAYARLVRVEPRSGKPYAVGRRSREA
jgi:sortase A